MTNGLSQQKLAVDSGAWPLYRYNPALAGEGKNPLPLDSKAPKIPLKDYVYNETRYSSLAQVDEERAEMLLDAGPARRDEPLAAVRAVGGDELRRGEERLTKTKTRLELRRTSASVTKGYSTWI